METYATTKGQVVIPVELRRKYGITAGTKFDVTDDGEKIILRPITPEFIRSLRGSLKGSGALKVLEEERRKEKFDRSSLSSNMETEDQSHQEAK